MRGQSEDRQEGGGAWVRNIGAEYVPQSAIARAWTIVEAEGIEVLEDVRIDVQGACRRWKSEARISASRTGNESDEVRRLVSGWKTSCREPVVFGRHWIMARACECKAGDGL